MNKNGNKFLSIFALGGLGEIGKNMYVVRYGEDIVIIDAGLKVPGEDMLGIDSVIPDITYLEDNRDKIRGILLTHGHDDHIGAVPYVLKRINVPVYGTKLTLKLLELKMKEAGVRKKRNLKMIHERSEIRLGSMKASFFPVNHSIPDSVGIILDTPEGRVVHTGDFKIDLTPFNRMQGELALARMAEIGKSGVLCLLSDSTNAEKQGFTISEHTVGESIKNVFHQAPGRIIIATSNSNLLRIQQVIDAAEQFRRKVAVVGKELENIVQIGIELGYLKMRKGTLVEPDALKKLSDRQVVMITCGDKGEALLGLTQMLRAGNRTFDIRSGDTVLIASSPTPGNEKSMSRIVDQLCRTGADVIYRPDTHGHIHVSGHGNQEELKLMLNMMKPKFFIPIHGDHRMLRKHAELAEMTNVKPEHIFIMDNGDSVQITKGNARFGMKVDSGQVLVDGLGVGDVGNIVLRDRKLLSEDGIIVVVVTLGKKNGQVLSGPDLISRGFVYVRESEKLLEEATDKVRQTLEECLEDQVQEWSVLKNNIRETLSHFLYEKTNRRPMVLPIIMEA